MRLLRAHVRNGSSLVKSIKRIVSLYHVRFQYESLSFISLSSAAAVKLERTTLPLRGRSIPERRQDQKGHGSPCKSVATVCGIAGRQPQRGQGDH